MLGPTLYEQTISAVDAVSAVSQAKLIEVDMDALGANAVYVSAEDGSAVWSLHTPFAPASE
jgi:hypothetical protein